MSWLPVVSREQYQEKVAECAELRREKAALEASLKVSWEHQASWSKIASDMSAIAEGWERRYDELLRIAWPARGGIGAMTVPGPADGWPDVKRATLEPEPVAASEPDEMLALIDIQCGRDYRKRQMMLAQLATDRAAGVDADRIRSAILHGVQSEGVPG